MIGHVSLGAVHTHTHTHTCNFIEVKEGSKNTFIYDKYNQLIF